MIPERCNLECGDILSNYRVDSVLGEGTYGIVYKATGLADNDIKAIKLLKLWTVVPELYKKLQERFVMEFNTGQIQSDCLTHTYSYGELKGNPYIVMEYCSGGDLRKHIGILADAEILPIVYRILHGLESLHAHGKVHRDLKPENVLLRNNRSMAVLTDFGVSGDINHRLTERNFMGKPIQSFGTYPYMPPEQINPPHGKATVLPTTDIFSFGVMLYELLVGELPYGPIINEQMLSDYIQNMKKGHWNRTALARVDTKGIWTPVIEGCLTPNYKERLQSVREILNILPADTNEQSEQYETRDKSYLKIRNGVQLRVTQGQDYGRIFRLDELMREHRTGVITIGRKCHEVFNMIALNDSDCYTSKCHCTIEVDYNTGTLIIRDGQWRKYDCPIALRSEIPCRFCTAVCSQEIMQTSHKWKLSFNGTFVNSTRVEYSGMIIKPGDIISIGDIKMRVEGY